MSKLHSDAFAKLEHVLLSFEYAFFIRVWSLHLGMLFSFGYALCIWVCMLFTFGYALFIRVWSLHLGMLFAFECALFIWVWYFHLDILFSFGYGLYIWIYYSFCICVKPFNRSPR